MNENYMKIMTIALVFVLGIASAAAVVLSIQEDDNTTNGGVSVPPVPENKAPIASMYASDTTISQGDGVRFDASASADSDGNVTAYYFDFGDGNTTGWQSQPIAEHIYPRMGEYTASLKVKDDSGTESTNDMRILISVREAPLSGDITPSSRSLDNFTEVEKAVKSSPLYSPPAEEIPDVWEDQPEIEIPNLPYQNTTENPELPVIEEPIVTRVKVDTGEDDPRDMNAGYHAYMVWENASEKFRGKMNEKMNGENISATHLKVDHVGAFEREFVRFNWSRDSPDYAKRINYRAMSAVNVSVHDSNGDGKPERLHTIEVAYEAQGKKENPRYESYYGTEIRMFDNNSDGNPEYLRINEFGFESVDKNGDGNSEYVLIYFRVVVKYDNNSDGYSEFVSSSNATFVSLDMDNDGYGKFQAAHFTISKAYDENRNGSFRYVNYFEWGTLRADSNNNSNDEYVSSFSKKMVFYDNTSCGKPNFVHSIIFGYISVDRNDDGESEMTEMLYHNLLKRDENGDSNPEYVFMEKCYTRRNDARNISLASRTRIVMWDNSSDGEKNYVHYEKSAWAVKGKYNNQVSSCKATVYQDFVLYKNNTEHQNASYIYSWSFTSAEDSDHHGNQNNRHYEAERYRMEDADQDGTPESIWHVRYEGNGE